ncbi:MAG: nicotinamidase [Acidimicrobiaceae bacterium]|jgi:nicotinamidase/pyrazinamidase|nr:nicotinamidase [Acidimicrobiaceae bacterium]|tara:strand:+ start:61845 stop:62417 length:573 start_codon:yes stop_codon:yes gene_type:complete
MTKSNRALVIVDVQPTFCEGGSLPVSGGDAVAREIADFLSQDQGYDCIVTTQDWHIDPGTHFSENPDYKDSWPDHGVAGTAEADLHHELANIKGKINYSVKKGMFQAAYSGFEGFDDHKRSLKQILDSESITDVDVVGLAFDHCVKATAIDSAKNGFDTRVLAHLSAAVLPEVIVKVSDEMRSHGVEVIH